MATSGPKAVAPPFTISVNALYYPPPHNRRLRNVIRISNDCPESEGDNGVLVYKLRGVNPDAYVVRPKSKCLRPQQSVEVAFTRHPEDEAECAELKTKKEGFQLEVARVLRSELPDEGMLMQPKLVFAKNAVSNVKKVFLECFFFVSEVPPAVRLSVVDAGDESPSTVSVARSISESPAQLPTPELVEAPTGGKVSAAAAQRASVQAAALTSASAAAADEGLAKAQAAFDEKRKLEQETKKEISSIKSDIQAEKKRVDEAQKVGKAYEGRAADLHRTEKAAKSSVAAGGSEGGATMPVSFVVFFMIVAYIGGCLLRQHMGGPISNWF